MEEWRDIPGWEGFYQASDLGRIKSVARTIIRSNGVSQTVREAILVPGSSSNGRQLVVLCKSGILQSRLVYHLVLEAFVGACPEGLECCHNDSNHLNNALSNLRWDTRASNESDKVTNGTSNRGERHGSAQLTEEGVLQIREKHATGNYIHKDLAVEYGVSRQQIGMIVRGKAWHHLLPV